MQHSSAILCVCAKKEEFLCLIDAAKHDVIFGSETWLKPGISVSEISLPGYHVYRKDRADGYGVCSWVSQTETEGEFVPAKVLISKHAIIFAVTYCQPWIDQTYVDSFNYTLSTLCHKAKLYKAAGPDNIPLMLHKEAAEKITLLF